MATGRDVKQPRRGVAALGNPVIAAGELQGAMTIAGEVAAAAGLASSRTGPAVS